MIACIYDYNSQKKGIKCTILMHEITCYQEAKTVKRHEYKPRRGAISTITTSLSLKASPFLISLLSLLHKSNDYKRQKDVVID